MIKLSIFIYFWTLISCNSSKTGYYRTHNDSIPKVRFCDLPLYKGQRVYIKCYYSGVDEYWSLNIGSKKCKLKLTVELEFIGHNPFLIPEKFESIFREVHNNYHDSFLEIEAIGTFENDRKHGYGHLGSNNSRFIVSELINASLVRR